jgi:hypothetical protein
MISNDTFVDKAQNPIFQAVITLVGVILVILASKLVILTGLLEVSERFPWMTACSFLLCFALFNSVFSLSAESMVKYWGKSIYSFLGLAFVSGFLAYLFSNKALSEAGSYWWIYIVVAIGYFVFLGMMAFIRTVVEFAQKEEWNQPKIRSKKRRP